MLLAAFAVLLCAYIASVWSVYVSDYLFALFWLLFLLSNVTLTRYADKTSRSTSVQMAVVCGLLLGFWVLNLIASIHSGINIHKKCALSGLIALLISTLAWARYSLQTHFYRGPRTIIEYISFNLVKLVPVILFVILSIPTLNLLFKSDSYTYYSMLADGAGKWNFSLCDVQPFRLGYHASYGYALFTYLGFYILPWQGIGIRVAHIILAVTAYFALASVLKKLFGGREDAFYVSTSACFLFNPLILGLIQEMNLDFPMTCFFCLFVWAHCTGKKVLAVFFAALTCFSKEIAIVLLFSYAIGVVIGRVISRGSRFRFTKVIRIWELCIAIPALFYMVDMFIQPVWGGSGGDKPTGLGAVNTFHINPGYIVFRLKELLVLNFQWVAIAVICLGVVFIIIKKEKLVFNPVLVGLALSMGAYVILTVLYFTYPHYRYLAPSAMYTPLIIGWAFYWVRGRMKAIAPLLIATLFGIQSFISVDPLSNCIFRQVNTGNGSIISLAHYSDDLNKSGILIDENQGGDLTNEVFRDYVQYNREYTQFQRCFECLLETIDYSDDVALVVYPVFRVGNVETAQYTFVNFFGVNEADQIRISETGTLTNSPFGEDINWVSIDNIAEEAERMDSIWVIQLPSEEPIYGLADYLSEFDVRQVVEQRCGIWEVRAFEVGL